MKTGLAFHIVVGVLVALSNAQRSVQDLEGVYSGDAIFPAIFVGTEDGRFTNFCLDEFPAACRREVGPVNETVTINATTIAFSLIQSEGIRTINESKKAYPSCVPTGRYPVELFMPLPPAEIQSFDPTTGHLTFIDPRRPDDLNCVIAQTEEGPKGKSLRIKFLVVSTTPENITVAEGPSLRCVVYNNFCIAETSIRGTFLSVGDVDYSLPCVSGACMGSEDK